MGGRTLVAWDMGLGKTIVALQYHRRNPHTWPCVVVCPAFVKPNWEAEAAIHISTRAMVLNSRTPPRGRLGFDANLYVINYDVLPAWVGWLRKRGIRSVFIDETQYIQNRNTIRTRAIRALCRGVKHILGLSGTPLTNCPAELYPILHLLFPRKFPSWQKYAHRYCEPELKRWGWTYRGARRLPELHRKIKAAGVLRRLKDDVLKDLPAKTTVVHTLEIRNRKEYEEANSDFIGWLRRQNAKAAHRAKRAEQIAKVGYMLRLAAKLKLKAVAQWLDDYLVNSDEKLVVFMVHHKAIDALAKHYRGGCTVIDGRMSIPDRQLAIKKFQHDKKCRLLFGNMQAAGTGINGLQTAARSAVFVELDPRPGLHNQAADRLHRIGQGRKVWVWWLIARDTIEERYCRLLQTKSKNISRVLDGRGRGEVLDIMDRLLVEMARDGK